MVTRDKANAAKPEARRIVSRLGAVVVSVGVEDAPAGGVRLSVGVSRGYDRLPTKDLNIEDVPVHIFQQSFGRLG